MPCHLTVIFHGHNPITDYWPTTFGPSSDTCIIEFTEFSSVYAWNFISRRSASVSEDFVPWRPEPLPGLLLDPSAPRPLQEPLAIPWLQLWCPGATTAGHRLKIGLVGVHGSRLMSYYWGFSDRSQIALRRKLSTRRQNMYSSD